MDKKSIQLIDVTKEHVQLLFNWRNKSFVREMMYDSNLILWDEHVEWFNSAIRDNKRQLKILYYNKIPYGLANFYLTDKLSNVGEWGFYIGEEYAPKGMGTILMYSMLEFLFGDLKVRKVCAEVMEFNGRSLNLHEKFGFGKDGILRKHVFKKNVYCDVHLYSIFKDEWNEAKIQIERSLFE